MNTQNATLSNTVITPAELLEHWQGHRRLTRCVIEAFPEDELFSHTIGGMRTFAEMAAELLAIAGPGLREIVAGAQAELDENIDFGNSKEEVLRLWDESTEEMDALWKQVPAERFHEQIKTFGQYEGTVISSILYFIDNEIHHRGQGYLYLRSLDVEPPYFWEQN
ncbi:MAG TPA: DinB family protein [Fodinibius sp.]|nr:DinB family protein [Fodinibius sp.]